MRETGGAGHDTPVVRYPLLTCLLASVLVTGAIMPIRALAADDDPIDPRTGYVTIHNVRRLGSGESAGVLPGDILLTVSGISPRGPAHADSLLAYGPATLSVMRGDSIIELELPPGIHGLEMGGPEAVVASQSVFLDGLDQGSFIAGEDRRAAAWAAISGFAGAPVDYETLLLVSGAAFWSQWYSGGASSSSARSDASWFDRKMAGAAGLSTTTGTLGRSITVARNAISAGYPAIATGFGGHGTVLVSGYQLYGDTLYGYNRFGQLVSAVSCSTVVSVSAVGPAPEAGELMEGVLPFARTIMYMNSWRPAIFDEMGRPETDYYAAGAACWESWRDWLLSESFPSSDSRRFAMAVEACRAVASGLSEKRSVASGFLEALDGYSYAASRYAEAAGLLDSLSSITMLGRLETPEGRADWTGMLDEIEGLESAAMESIMSSP